jgi:(p)ppGpp synthase/HD superfamily hydrolase
MVSLRDKALIFATEKHFGQTRRFTKEPYINHPKRVAEIVEQYTDDENLIVAAILHDALEDTPTTFDELAREFNLTIADLVWELTNDEGRIDELGKALYLLEKMIDMTDDALLIKLADRLDNTSGFELGLDKMKVFINNYRNETYFILDNLTDSGRSLTDAHRKLIARIYQNCGKV